jgi:3-hydroxyisobutyrate dehydrogenase-like beta-hydroxyacid dehydrogenase
MRVTIVGTGDMARGIAARALAGGHHDTDAPHVLPLSPTRSPRPA